jgi:DNA invertase Pin-like site-specific DNA recombinase
MSEKVQARHLARGAILYVRQSSAHQVQHNEESRRLQYAMADRLRALGWRDIETIDEDLGKSAAGKTERSGFQRLVSEVSLGKVGAISARELSRFARNSMDWQKLMEVCRYVDTLLVDHDAIYDIRQSNDRLLLGLKGNLNEYELEMLRVRAHEAKAEKARRGEYYGKIAVGYRKTLEGGIEKHPDARVQHSVSLIFDKMLELGSARQVLLWMREHRLEVPVNRNDRGEVQWKSPGAGWLYMVLTNPIYAGTYAYGRTMPVATITDDGSFRRTVKRKALKDTSVLLHDRHDGYIGRDVFERIQTMLTKNSQIHRRPGPGAARVGPALLAGLLRCRRCGERLIVNYGGSTVRVHRYECSRANLDRGEARCINFSGLDVDARVSELVVRVVEPAAVEASAKLASEDASQRDAASEALHLELKAARYAAERAERQYDAVEPENRLVVDELERRWNVALERVHSLEARLDEARSTASTITIGTGRFVKLSADVARLWHSDKTDVRLKKRIVRALIEEIVTDTTESDVSLVVHWKGGVHTEVSVPRRRRGQNRAQTAPETIEAVRLLARVCPDEQIARAFNVSGIKTARGNLWTSTLVRSFRSDHEIAKYTSDSEAAWLNLAQAAKLAAVAELTLKRAIERGVVSALRPVSHGPWILERAQLLRPDILERLTKKPRLRAGEPAAPSSTQLTLIIPRT